MLKILKVKVQLEVKGDLSEDPEDFRDRIYDKLHLLMENEELEFEIDEENSEEMDLED